MWRECGRDYQWGVVLYVVANSVRESAEIQVAIQNSVIILWISGFVSLLYYYHHCLISPYEVVTYFCCGFLHFVKQSSGMGKSIPNHACRCTSCGFLDASSSSSPSSPSSCR